MLIEIILGFYQRLSESDQSFGSLSLPAATFCGPLLARLMSSLPN
jgi:hypothetical protein